MITVNPKRAFVDVDGRGSLMSGRIVARRDSRVFVLVDRDSNLDEWYAADVVSELDGDA